MVTLPISFKSAFKRLYRPFPKITLEDMEQKPLSQYIDIYSALSVLQGAEISQIDFSNANNKNWRKKTLIHILALIGICCVGLSLWMAGKTFSLTIIDIREQHKYTYLAAIILMLTGTITLWLRERFLKTYISEENVSTVSHTTTLEYNLALLRLEDPDFFEFNQNTKIKRIHPNPFSLSAWRVFILGTYADRCKLLIEGDIPSRFLFIKRSTLTALLANKEQQHSNISPWEPFRDYLCDEKQLRSLVSVIHKIELDKSLPKELQLTKARRKYYKAFLFILKNWKTWELSLGNEFNSQSIKQVQKAKRDMRIALNSILNFNPHSQSYDQFIDGTYPALVKWIDAINNHLKNIS